MVKHTQTICWQKPTNCLSVFDHFVGWALKGLSKDESFSINPFNAIVPFLYPLVTSETFGFLMFSGGIETRH